MHVTATVSGATLKATQGTLWTFGAKGIVAFEDSLIPIRHRGQNMDKSH